MSTTEMTYGSAIRETLKEEMKKNPNIIIIGEDVGKFGGAFKVTLGLQDEFGPDRVIDTPISESAIVGVALGAALMGIRPVAEIMYMDFLQLSMQQLVTQAARARYLSGGKLSVPMVLRTQYSLGRTYGPQHSQFFPSWFSQAPGLKVVAPSTPADARGLLKSALLENNPVLFIECGSLYTTTGKVDAADSRVKIGEAEAKRPGRDITIVAISRVLNETMAAAEKLAEAQIEAEVIDPRTLQPLDSATIAESVKKTGRLLIAADDFAVGGIGATIESAILEDVFFNLKAPIRILGSPNFPVPSNVVLEKEYMIGRDKIVEAATKLVSEA
jgi:pyruvate/2-oxoglutarate/acetoin dehydrogenase E1 component